jgi:hypothetical protein
MGEDLEGRDSYLEGQVNRVPSALYATGILAKVRTQHARSLSMALLLLLP